MFTNNKHAIVHINSISMQKIRSNDDEMAKKCVAKLKHELHVRLNGRRRNHLVEKDVPLTVKFKRLDFACAPVIFPVLILNKISVHLKTGKYMQIPRVEAYYIFQSLWSVFEKTRGKRDQQLPGGRCGNTISCAQELKSVFIFFSFFRKYHKNKLQFTEAEICSSIFFYFAVFSWYHYGISVI